MPDPEPALAALSELLSGKSDLVSDALVQVRCGYKIREVDWACQLITPQNETWYFRPIALNGCDLSEFASVDPQQTDKWSHNPGLSEQAQAWMNQTLVSLGLSDLGPSLCVIQCQTFGTVLSVLCTGLDLVAVTLQSWGNPPEPVVRDWKRQLNSHRQFLGELSTAETLVTENGTLIPLLSLVQMLETDSAKKNLAAKRKVTRSCPFLISAPTWPECIGSATRAVPIVHSSTVHSSTEAKASDSIFGHRGSVPVSERSIAIPTKKSSIQKWIATGAAGTCVVVMAVWSLNWNGEQVASTAKPTVQSSPATEPIKINAESRDDDSRNSVTAPDDGEIVLTLEPGPTMTGAVSTTPELTLENLLAELSSNKASPIRLDSLNASSIVAEVFTPQGADTSAMPSFSTIEEDLGQPDEKTAAADISATVSDGGVITLERPIELNSAVSKETIAVGKFVLAKACRCDVTLKVASELVVEPVEKAAIEGTGKAQWKIAIEDEEPELLVEVVSKPGARWQIMVSVGLRETRSSPPMLIGPRQAQNVGNRLIDFRKWLKSTIETLRTARSNNRGRSDFDFTGQIKKLEEQDREAEKAIERWKVIARLSHYFFDSNDLRLQLTAIAK